MSDTFECPNAINHGNPFRYCPVKECGWTQRVDNTQYDPSDSELSCPSVDVCGWCGDSECDGIGCIASLDPNDAADHEAIEQLHCWLRRGQLSEQSEKFLASQENRRWQP